MKQFDVSDPANPKQVGSVRLGGIVDRAPHPAMPDMPLAGGPQMVEVGRDGKRVYRANSLYGAWDDQFYPDGVGAWMAKLDAEPNGGLASTRTSSRHGEEFSGLRVHQIRLQGGDASSDSYCYNRTRARHYLYLTPQYDPAVFQPVGCGRLRGLLHGQLPHRLTDRTYRRHQAYGPVIE